MSYPIPTFNLLANIWNAGHTPAVNVPDYILQACQLYSSPHNCNWFNFGNPGGGVHFSGMASLCKFPVGTAVFTQSSIIQPDFSTGSYYIVVYDQLFYRGFPQQFQGAWCVPCSNTGVLKYAYG